MPNVGKNLSWCALLPNFKKNQKRKLVSSQIRLVHFPHLRGQLCGVTSQIHSFLSIFWHVGLRRCASLSWEYSRVSLSVWPLAVVRLAFTDKIRRTGREMLLCLCWLIFQQPTTVKQAKFGAAKNFLLLCIRKACILCYCALSRSLAKICLQDTSVPHFSKTLRSLRLILSWTAVVKSKNKFNHRKDQQKFNRLNLKSLTSWTFSLIQPRSSTSYPCFVKLWLEKHSHR